MSKQLIKKAIGITGSQHELAKACGVTQPAVWKWLNLGKKLNLERAYAIEKATKGEVTARQLRPDFFESQRA